MTSLLRPRQRPSCSKLSTHRRYLSSTSPAHQARRVRDEDEGGTEDYKAWIQSEGRKWQYPDSLGPKWLGGNVVRSSPSHKFVLFNDS